MEKVKIFVSTSNFTKNNENNLNLILENIDQKYNKIEIGSGHKTNEDSIRLIKELLNNGNEILLHNYSIREENNLMVNLCEADDDLRRKIIDYVKEMIDLTRELGNDYYSIHGGFYSKDSSISLEKQKENYHESVSEILEYAKGKGIMIGVENHVVEKRNIDKLFLTNVEEFEDLFDRHKDDNLKLHLDLGHLKVSGNVLDFSVDELIKKFSDKVIAIHIHENDGEVDLHNGFDSNAYFLKYLKEFKNLKYIVIESWNQSDSNLDEMIRRLEDEVAK